MIKRKFYKILIFFFIIATLFFIFSNKNSLSNASAETITRETSEIVMEVNSKRVLHEKNCHDKKYMASTTKILTAICAIENIDINMQIKIPAEAVGIEGSSIYLKENETLTIKELLYGLMLRSGNDCATALAIAVSGSIDDFAILMNKKAGEIGAKNSSFTNPHGLHDDNHYTTAYDLGLISCYAMQNETFREIVGTKKISISNEFYDYDRILINKNKMLFRNDNSTGIKTGYTKKAGRCLVSSRIKDGMEVVCVVLSCPDMWEKSNTLLDSALGNYRMIKVLESDNILDFNDNPPTKTIAHAKNDVYLPLLKDEYNKVKYEIIYLDNIQNAINKDTPIGKINFYIENNLIFEEKIYTII